MKKLLKVIPLYTDESKLIRRACLNNKEAQKIIYNKYASKMLSVCRYYISDLHFAEDVMITGFLKVFTNIKSFKSEGSFEGWIRKIMIRESVSFLRSKKQMIFVEDQQLPDQKIICNHEMDVDDIQLLIDQLPNGYKTVFVMYAVEGYSHKEIAEMLNITESTSKSQLHKGKKMLQEKIHKLNLRENGTI